MVPLFNNLGFLGLEQIPRCVANFENGEGLLYICLVFPQLPRLLLVTE